MKKHPKKSTVWYYGVSHIRTPYIYIYIFFFLNQHLVKSKRKKTKGRQAIFTARLRQKKKSKKKMWDILSKYFCPLFTPIFNPIWRDCVWRERRENLWTPPKSLMFSTLNQTTKNIIFSPVLSPSFSILLKITPTKYSLKLIHMCYI